MHFVSRIVISVGAFLASARDFSSRPDPGGYTNLVHPQLGTLNIPQVTGHSATPVHKTYPSRPAFRVAPSRNPFGCAQRFIKIESSRPFVHSTLDRVLPASTSTYSIPNTTLLDDNSTESTILTVLPYDGSKDLAHYDGRRALITFGYHGSRELAVYYRPTALLVYTGPTNYVRFWVNPSHHELVAYVYRPRFVVGTYLAKEYSHLDPTNFGRWTVDNPIDMLLASDRSYLLEVFGLTSPLYITLGKFERRFEERGSWVLAYLYVVGILLALGITATEEYTEPRKALRRDHSAVLTTPSRGDCDSVALPGVMNQALSEELDAVTEGNWWKIDKKGEMEAGYLTPTKFLELPVITTPEPAPTPSPTSPDVPTISEFPEDPKPFTRAVKVLPPRPSGPRFKTAAWRRCRVK
ncbi:hypothetical protein FRC11_010955 [Ceratobasidium sp. 423]|nr:hypothetical protein FRC11_010955 [Ceratobasidium sp. 423]